MQFESLFICLNFFSASKRSTRPRSTPATPKDTPKTPDRTKRETKTSKIKKQETVSSDEGKSPEDQRRSTRYSVFILRFTTKFAKIVTVDVFTSFCKMIR